MWRTVIRNVMGVLAFFLVFAIFPNQWLLGLGLDAMWVGWRRSCQPFWRLGGWLAFGRR